MTAIWQESPDGAWTLLTPAGFPDERTLHDLVAQAPHLLPLSGSPRLIVLGREVLLGSGYADLLAVEPDGRPVIIETKLRNNAESRRAVVAQVLAYAAALHGISAEQFERDVLRRHLDGRSLIDVVRESAQEESPDAPEFAEMLTTTLRDGTFRLVLSSINPRRPGPACRIPRDGDFWPIGGPSDRRGLPDRRPTCHRPPARRT